MISKPARRCSKWSIPQGNWPEIERHVALAAQSNPDDAVVRLGQLALDYRQSIAEEDTEASARLAAEAEAMKEEMPDEIVLYDITIDHHVRAQQFEQALADVESAIALRPEDLKHYQTRLVLLEQMGDISGVELQLREMVANFPDNPQIRATLIRWYLSNDNIDAAEAYLRERAEAEPAALTDLVQFLARFVNVEAALDELDTAIAAGRDEASLRAMRAGLMFETGQRQEAIDALNVIVEETEPSDERRKVQVGLAKMLSATGNEVGARALVEEILEEDGSNVEALKMRAQWLIAQDETDEAIITLRQALDQSPRDPETLLLMAAAHERGGSRELMGEMLSLAMEASNNAPSETLQYVRYLVADGKLDSAETALVDALRLAPDNVELLKSLGSLYVRRADWPRAEQVLGTLKRQDSQDADAAANGLQAAILSGQNKTDDVVSFLEDLVESGEGGLGAQVAILRTYIQSGNLDAARNYVVSSLEERPDDLNLRFLSASLDELEGNVESAENAYIELLKERPNAVLAWRALFLLQMRDGRTEVGEQTLNAAIEANPRSLDLLWAKASLLQQQDRNEDAIEIYEEMYEMSSGSALVANNLASLLTTLRDDEESLQRAYSVARRLRNSEVPAFRDTYGWIAYRRGEIEEALAHLEPAAAGLPQDALTQYHLAMTYMALDRPQDALVQFEKAVSAAGPDSELPQIVDARARIEALKSSAEAETK